MWIGSVLEHAAATWPQRTALIFGEETWTFTELHAAANRVGNALRAGGVGRGEHVALLLPNSPEWVFAYFATLKLGAVVVPIDLRLGPEELGTILSHADLTAAVSFADLPETVSHALTGPRRTVPLHLRLRRGEPPCAEQPDELEAVAVAGDDVAAILYTSGTTGTSRGVMLTYDNFSHFPDTLIALYRMEERDVLSIAVPMSHISGPIVCNLLVATGAPLVLFESFHPLHFLETVQRHRITYFHLVPPMFAALLRVPHPEQYDLSSVRIGATFGMASSPELLRQFQRQWPEAKLVEGYGLTETSPFIALTPSPIPADKIGSVGRIVPNVEAQVVDDKDQEVPVGQVGEIVTRGPHLMKGYYRDPEATAEVIRDGWLHTGDLGRFDEDGYLWVVGRKKDVINVGGLKVYAPEVEDTLYSHPKVAEAAVIGVPDARRGEAVRAVIVPRPGETLTAEEVQAYCRQRLADYKVPRQVEFRAALPKSEVGKILKRELLQEAAHAVAS